MELMEEKGSKTIESFVGTLPASKQKKAATNLISELHQQLSTLLVKQRLTETKMKKLVARINETDPAKAVKQMKKEIRDSKKATEKLALMLLGAKKMARQMGLEMPDIKSLEV